MPISRRLELSCHDRLRVEKVDFHRARVTKQVLVVIIEHDAPGFDHGELHVDHGLLVDGHVGEVESRSVDIQLEGVVDKVIIVEIKEGWERSDGYHAIFAQLQVPVHVGHAVLEQVLLDQVGDGLRHAKLQTGLVISQTPELHGV